MPHQRLRASVSRFSWGSAGGGSVFGLRHAASAPPHLALDRPLAPHRGSELGIGVAGFDDAREAVAGGKKEVEARAASRISASICPRTRSCLGVGTAKEHGSLGGQAWRRLAAVRIRDVMTESVVTAAPDTSVREVAEIMRERNVGSVVLVDGGRLAGFLTDRDLTLSVLADGRDPIDRAGDHASAPWSRARLRWTSRRRPR